MSTNISSNISLEDFNAEKALALAPVTAYLFTLMTIGIVGNSLVCYIYSAKFKRTPSNYFILSMAVIDIANCTIGIPFETADLLLPLSFDAPAACKISRFIETVSVCASATILICIALDRYYKICKPLKAFPLRKTKISCIIAASLGVFLAWPTLIVFGTKTIKDSDERIEGYECSTDDSIRGTMYDKVYYGILIFAFVVAFTIIAVLYTAIAIRLFKRKRTVIGEAPSINRYKYEYKPKWKRNKTSSKSSKNENGVNCIDLETVKRDETRNQTTPKQQASTGTKRNIRTTKATVIFFAITSLFVLTFVPFLVMMTLRSLKIAFVEYEHEWQEVLFNFGVRSYFLSNTMNPLVYVVMDDRFRKEVRKLMCACRAPTKNDQDINMQLSNRPAAKF